MGLSDATITLKRSLQDDLANLLSRNEFDVKFEAMCKDRFQLHNDVSYSLTLEQQMAAVDIVGVDFKYNKSEKCFQYGATATVPMGLTVSLRYKSVAAAIYVRFPNGEQSFAIGGSVGGLARQAKEARTGEKCTDIPFHVFVDEYSVEAFDAALKSIAELFHEFRPIIFEHFEGKIGELQ